MNIRIKHPLTKYQKKKLIKKAGRLLDNAEYHVDQIILAAQQAEKHDW